MSQPPTTPTPPTFTHQQRRELAEKIQKYTFEYLISRTPIDRVIALQAATDAANQHGLILALALSENNVAVDLNPWPTPVSTEPLCRTIRSVFDDMPMSVRTYNILANAEISTLGNLASMTEREILRLKNCGTKSLQEMRQILATYGLTFRKGDQPG
jgi:DNA-directed RNA polymerase subunit alpha